MRHLRTAAIVAVTALVVGVVMMVSGTFAANVNSGTFSMKGGTALNVTCPNPLTNTNVAASSETVNCAANTTTTAPSTTTTVAPTTTTASTTTTVPSATTSTVASGSGFVTRQDQSLYLNGSPFRFVGFNMWRANVTSAFSQSMPTSYNVNDGTTLSDSLTAINTSGGRQDAFRAWFVQQETLNNGVTDWAPFDKTLAVAAANNFKVIPVLIDEWNYDGHPTLDSTWYQSGYRGTVEPHDAVPYRQYVQQVVARYANNPNILMWEMVNEPDVEAGGTCQSGDESILADFVSDIGGLIKSSDPNHLVSLGAAGNGNCGTIEGDYQTIMGLSALDICSFHDYEGATNAGAYNQNNGLNVRISQCATVDKPVYVGEVGIHLNDPAVGGNLSTRATLLNNKMSAQFAMQGMVGYLPWQWDSRGYSDDYNYSVNDPALAVVDGYCF